MYMIISFCIGKPSRGRYVTRSKYIVLPLAAVMWLTASLH